MPPCFIHFSILIFILIKQVHILNSGHTLPIRAVDFQKQSRLVADIFFIARRAIYRQDTGMAWTALLLWAILLVDCNAEQQRPINAFYFV